MIAYEFRNMNETLRMVYELDDFSFNVLANSKCKVLDSLANFKSMEGKAPINAGNMTLSMNTTEDYRVDLSSMPMFIALNNKKLTTAQATNSTEDKTKYLYTMGEQLGLATKLYAVRGK